MRACLGSHGKIQVLSHGGSIHCLFLKLPLSTVMLYSQLLYTSETYDQEGGGVEETRSKTKKRCSHNLQSGRPAWWSADNYSIFPTVKFNIWFQKQEANRQRKSEMLKNFKKIIPCIFVFLAYRICLSVLKCGGN